jgi:hypothetical protein
MSKSDCVCVWGRVGGSCCGTPPVVEGDSVTLAYGVCIPIRSDRPHGVYGMWSQPLDKTAVFICRVNADMAC